MYIYWCLITIRNVHPTVPTKVISDLCLEREREMFYLTMHSTHFIYGYMVSDIWLRTILIVRKETCFRHIGYSYRLTAKVLLYAPSHRQDNTHHSLCYTSHGALAGTRNMCLEGHTHYDTGSNRINTRYQGFFYCILWTNEKGYP